MTNDQLKDLTAKIRKNAIDLDAANISHSRLVRLGDQRWDLMARYQTEMKKRNGNG